MRKYRLLSFIIIISFFFFSNPLEGQKKQKDSKANAAFEAGEYYNAIDLYKNAFNRVSDYEKKAEIYFKIGECYRITGDPRQAELWYNKAVRQEYQDPVVFLRFAQMKLINEKYEEAIEEFKKYRELVPDDPRG